MVCLIFHDKKIENFLLSATELLCCDSTTDKNTVSGVYFCDSASLDEVSTITKESEAVVVLVSRDKSERKLCTGGMIFLPYPFQISTLMSILGGGVASSSLDPSLEFDRESCTVTLGKSSVTLTERECRLFEFLLTHSGECVSREEICENVWERQTETNVADVYISYLRKKLTPILGGGAIRSVRGQGYILDI